MKRLFTFLLLLLPALFMTAQNNIVVMKFTAQSSNGQYVKIDSVNVWDLTMAWEQTLNYPDTTLVLVDSYGVEENTAASGLSQNHPNPFHGTTEAELTLAESGQVCLQIVSIDGRVLAEKNLSLEQGEHRVNVSLAEPRMAFLRVMVGKHNYAIKLLNLDNGGVNDIGVSTIKKESVRNTKAVGAGAFMHGDWMQYEAYSSMGTTRIVQQQMESENITFVFDGSGVSLPTVTTNEITGITFNSGTGGGIVTDDGGAAVTERGICWSVNFPTIEDAHTSDGSGLGAFVSSISNLTPETHYYVRAYATNSAGTAYGNLVEFVTTSPLPVVTTNSVSGITINSAVCGGNVTSEGASNVTARGVCWGTYSEPTLDYSHTTDGTGAGGFTSNITGLSNNATYYVRAYATNSYGTAYGEVVEFVTNPDLPVVTTNEITNITSSTASCNYSVTSDGGSSIVARGVCWSTSQLPTVSDSHTTSGTGTGNFVGYITDLSINTTYYVRAYATNNAGTSYGEQKVFSTNVPTVTTSAVTNITNNSATCGGNVTNEGGSDVTERGVCWSTNPNPTTASNHIASGSGTGSFTCTMTEGISANVTYYVRAYAKNSIGTSYGEQKQFSTYLPTVTTSDVTNISHNFATCGGNVTNVGGSAVTSRGICWSTSQNPTITDNQVVSGSGQGSFTGNMTNLSANTTYYVRAFATSSIGTAYGSQKTFTTLNGLPTVVTSTDVSAEIYVAYGGGEVTSEGGSSVTARGVCYSTSQNPTLSDNHTTNGTGTGTFSSTIGAGGWLTENTTYYIRAYATNSYGTAYGAQVSVKTHKPCPTGGISGNSSYPGLYTVGNDKLVYFSQGNLQKSCTGSYYFADKQWDYIGNDNITSLQNNWGYIDLFGWGTANNPTNTSTSTNNYTTFTDWGTKPISNGGNAANIWRTLTSDEWNYLLFQRIAYYRFAKATVNGVKGLIIFPDVFSSWSITSLNITCDDTSIDYSVNVIQNETMWNNYFGSYGAVFLPAAGSRSGTTMYLVNSEGAYWSSSQGSTQSAYSVLFNASQLLPTYNAWNYYGYSVRLVSDY